MIAGIEMENFTVFEDLKIALSPRINVIVGSNGTGKTHLLKAIHALAIAGQPSAKSTKPREGAVEFTQKLLRLFSPDEDRIATLRARGSTGATRLCLKGGDDSDLAITFNSNSRVARRETEGWREGHEPQPVFIPTKEVLSLVRGMRHPAHDRATVEMIFDDTYIDLAELLGRPGFEDEAATIQADPRLSGAIGELVGLVGGRYCWTNDGAFRFEPGRYEEVTDPDRSQSKTARAYQDSTVTRFVSKGTETLSSGMTAEGYRKIGVLHRLLTNGSINPGGSGVLLWDEPEANLNPKLMKKLVQILLELSRSGQQIILATHDYVLLKWLDLLIDKGKEDHVRFHALYRNPQTEKLTVESADSYSLISKSAISDTFAELFDEDLARAVG